MVSVNFSHVIAVHAVAPGLSSSGCHLPRELQHGSARHAGQRRDAHLHLLDRHPLRERGRDRVVHVLREGVPTSGSFMNRAPADESQRGCRRHARSTRRAHRRRRSLDLARPPRRACVLRASLRGRRARREVGRVEGAKIERRKNAPNEPRKSKVRCHVDQSDDFSTKVSNNLKLTWHLSFDNLKSTWHLSLKENLHWFQLTCHTCS